MEPHPVATISNDFAGRIRHRACLEEERMLLVRRTSVWLFVVAILSGCQFGVRGVAVEVDSDPANGMMPEPTTSSTASEDAGAPGDATPPAPTHTTGDACDATHPCDAPLVCQVTQLGLEVPGG